MNINIMLAHQTNDESKSSFELSALFVGSEKCSNGHSFGPYIRDCFLVHYCLSGKGIFETPNAKYELGAGDIFIILPGEPTVYTADKCDPWEYVWIAFTGDAAKQLCDVTPVVQYKHDTFLRLKSMIDNGKCTYERSMSLLWDFFCNIKSDKKPESNPLDDVKSFIQYNYMNDITVESIARRAYLDRRYLSREYKKRFGLTIRDELIAARMRAACDFLKEGYSVASSAKMAGYTDVFNFSKIFKKQLGVPPRDYAKGKRQP